MHGKRTAAGGKRTSPYSSTSPAPQKADLQEHQATALLVNEPLPCPEQEGYLLHPGVSHSSLCHPSVVFPDQTSYLEGVSEKNTPRAVVSAIGDGSSPGGSRSPTSGSTFLPYFCCLQHGITAGKLLIANMWPEQRWAGGGCSLCSC